MYMEMPHRDPETGRFLAGDSGPDVDRFEEMYSQDHYNVAAADLDGGTAQDFGEDQRISGKEVYSLEQPLDRDELAVLMWAEHHITAYFASTASADSTIRAAVEISAAPEREVVDELGTAGNVSLDSDISGGGQFTLEVDEGLGGVQSADLIGRPMQCTGFGPITDGTNGVGGAGTEGQDWWEGQPAADPTFDARDDVFTNMVVQISNASDLSAHIEVSVRHVFGVMEDFFD